MLTLIEQTPTPTASTATPQQPSLRSSQTVEQAKSAVIRLKFKEIDPVEGTPVEASLIWGKEQQALPANTANGVKGKYVVSSTTVVNFNAFATEINAFLTQPFATAEDCRNAFYKIADKYTVRASIWEDNADLNALKNYGQALGMLKKDTWTDTKTGEVKSAWTLNRVSSNVQVAKSTERSFGTALATPISAPSAPAPQGVPQPVMAGPTPPSMKKMSDGTVYSVEALTQAGWAPAQISALADA
jgi:hypothetical protein